MNLENVELQFAHIFRSEGETLIEIRIFKGPYHHAAIFDTRGNILEELVDASQMGLAGKQLEIFKSRYRQNARAFAADVVRERITPCLN